MVSIAMSVATSLTMLKSVKAADIMEKHRSQYKHTPTHIYILCFYVRAKFHIKSSLK